MIEQTTYRKPTLRTNPLSTAQQPRCSDTSLTRGTHQQIFWVRPASAALSDRLSRRYLRDRRLSPNLRISGVVELAAKDCVKGLPGFGGKTP
jgi:hypothetical protein